MSSKISSDPNLSSMYMRTTYAIGYEFESRGVLLRVVERPELQYPAEACRGCFFSGYSTCCKSQCSSFGRTDGKNVWFVPVSELN